MYKKYQLTKLLASDLNLVLSDGRKVVASFIGGFMLPKRTPGYYATTDILIQEALENHKWFNVNYKLVAKNEKITTFVLQPSEAKHPDLPEGGDHGLKDNLVYHISNAKEAKAWLKENMSGKITSADLKSINTIDDFCVKNHIVFPDWLTMREK
jgi:hypothetical protein